MGIPDGAHTHGHGSGGGVGTAVLILVAAALVSAAAWPVIAAVTDLLRIVLIITSTVAAPVGAAGIALAAWRLRHAGKKQHPGYPWLPQGHRVPQKRWPGRKRNAMHSIGQVRFTCTCMACPPRILLPSSAASRRSEMSTRLGARASHYMAIDWVADSAALATAAFTGLLAVVAYVQLGGQRKDLQQVGNKLDALRAEALEADLAPKRRQEYRDRRSLAEQVRLRRVNSEELLVAPSTTPISYGYLEVINGSDQPIRTVDVWFADEYAYDAGQLDPDAPEPRQLLNRQRPTLAEIRPGDTWYFLVLPTSRYDAQDADVCAWFTDANGARWRKNMIGQLDEIAPTPSLPSGQDQSPSG